MNTHLLAAITISSALLATMGSLFLAYDYLEAFFSKEKNPLRQLMRFFVPTLTGMVPGLILYLVFSAVGVTDIQFLNVTISAIALGFLTGFFCAFYMRLHDYVDATPGNPSASLTRVFVMQPLRRAVIGLILGMCSIVVVALLLGTTVDNALTSAGSAGPLAMVVNGVWPLIEWTPAETTEPRSPQWRHDRQALKMAVLGIGILSLGAGLVNGIFDARAPQTLYKCVSVGQRCADVLTLPAAIRIGGTTLIHGVIFLLGGMITCFLWVTVQYWLPFLWDHLFASTPRNGRLFGVLITSATLGYAGAAMLRFVKEAAPTAISDSGGMLAIVGSLLLIGGGWGFLLPIRPVRDSVQRPFPFCRYDAVMMAGFGLCILLPYITLTNFGDLTATILGLPHEYGAQTIPPIQFQRIAFFWGVAFLVGAPVAFGVGGLTRAVYRWSRGVSHHILGAVGIGLGLVAFLLQLIQPTSVLLSK